MAEEGIIIKRDTWRDPWSNYKNASFIELNREILRKRRVGTYSQRNPFYGNHLLPASKTWSLSGQIQTFRVLASLTETLSTEKNPLFPPRAKETSYIRLLRLVETTSILLQLGWKKLKEGFTLEEWLPRDHFYIFHENVPLLHPTIMYNERKLHWN